MRKKDKTPEPDKQKTPGTVGGQTSYCGKLQMQVEDLANPYSLN